MVLSADIEKLKWISPSSFTALEKCPYKIALSNTFDEPLLPLHPNIHLGNVIHKCIELIYSGKITDESTFDQKWEKLIEEQEKKLKEIGFSFLIPLEKSTDGFSIKKIQAKRLLRKGISKGRDWESKCSLERWVSSKDEKVVGKIDLLFQRDNYSKIIDFKSGKVLDADDNIKQTYVTQLKLYAYLYNQEFDRYPSDVSIIDLNSREYTISFKPEECERLGAKAKNFLENVNEKIEKDYRKELANPSEENCDGCQYKPACKFHWVLNGSKSNQKFTDLKGKLVSVRKFDYGNINLSLKTKEQIVIEGFDTSMYDYFKKNESEVIAIFNVLNLDKPNRFRKMKTTRVFSTFAR